MTSRAADGTAGGAGPTGRRPPPAARDHGRAEPAERGTTDLLGLYFDEVGRHQLLTADDEVALAQVIERGRLAADRLRMQAEPDVQLQQRVAEGRAAFDRFVSANLRLVVHVARPYARRTGQELGELVQEGNIGLLRAVERFDWRRGFRFSTFATWWIRQAVQRATAKQRAIGLPLLVHEVLLRTRAASDRLEAELGRSPDVEEVAAAINARPDQVRHALASNFTVASLDAPAGSGAEASPLGTLVAVAGDAPDDEVAQRDLVRSLRSKADEVLDPRSRHVISRRFGLDGADPASLAALARELRTSSATVRKLERDALARLREELADAS